MNAATTLALTRSAIGASAWLMPITAGRLFGIDASGDVSAALYLRLGGTRDFALAAGPLLTDGPARARMVKVAAACDVADIAAAIVAHRTGKATTLSATLFVGASLGCLALGARSLAKA
ncbi:hypothetical protein [Paraconexibacter sp. AEG42_29]